MILWITLGIFLISVGLAIAFAVIDKYYQIKENSFDYSWGDTPRMEIEKRRQQHEEWSNKKSTKWIKKHIHYKTNVPFYVAIGAAIPLTVMCLVLIFSYCNLDAQIAQNQARYESLTYQYEANVYGTDNDAVGNYELHKSIQEWNEDLAWSRAAQNDFWIGVFIPDIYNQFEFIPWKPNDAVD